MTSTICLIDTSPAVDEALINKITTILPKSVTVKKRTYIQAIAGIPPEVIAIVFIFVSASLARGFLEELGNDAYNRLKSTLRNYPSKERERTLVLDFKSKRTKISFRCE